METAEVYSFDPTIWNRVKEFTEGDVNDPKTLAIYVLLRILRDERKGVRETELQNYLTTYFDINLDLWPRLMEMLELAQIIVRWPDRITYRAPHRMARA